MQATDLKERLRTAFNGMPSATKRWAVLGLLIGGAFVLIYLVILARDGESRKPAFAPASAKAQPTNVDNIIAPGSGLKPEESWVATANRDLARIKDERERDKQAQAQRQAAEEAQRKALLDRFESLQRSLGQPVPPAAPASAPVALPPGTTGSVATSPPTGAVFPPPAALPQAGGLPPSPPPPLASARGAFPPGFPGTSPAGGPAAAAEPAAPALVRVALPRPTGTASGAAGNAAQPVDTFLPVSFTRGVLLSGMDAPTGSTGQSNPLPVVVYLTDTSVLPNRFRADFKECMVIGAGHGDDSSERGYIRAHSLSCVRRDGSAMQLPIKAEIFGHDGKPGIRGRRVSKQGQLLLNAFTAGIVGGLGKGVQTSATDISSSALGQVSTVQGGNAFKAGIGGGIGNALDRLAQYYIRRAEELVDIIEVDPGLEVDVLLLEGVKIPEGGLPKVSTSAGAAAAGSYERYFEAQNHAD